MTAALRAGFSMIELLVVVAVLSVLAIGASLALPRAGPAAVTDRAAFLAEDMRLREEALLTRTRQGLRVNPAGFQRVLLQPDGQWQAAGPPNPWAAGPDWLAPADLPALIAYLPDGRATPIDLVFAEPGGAVRCRSDGWGPPACAPR